MIKRQPPQGAAQRRTDRLPSPLKDRDDLPGHPFEGFAPLGWLPETRAAWRDVPADPFEKNGAVSTFAYGGGEIGPDYQPERSPGSLRHSPTVSGSILACSVSY